MGGGGAMRAAAKAAGIGLQNTGIRGGLPENFSASRKVMRQSTSALSSTASVDDTARLEFAAAPQAASAITWELDDWEFAGYAVEDQPRLVFGPPPSLDETKEATSELTAALDKMYFSPCNSAGSFGSVSAVDDNTVVSKSETSLADTKACVVNETSVVPSVPTQALKAFQLLRENSAAQTVVASIAADPNVWNAVLQNETLKEYLQSEKKFIAGMESEEKKPLTSSEIPVDLQDVGNSENVLSNVYENLKLAVVGWVNNLSGFFQDLFGGPDMKPASGPASLSPSSTVVGGSLLGLAVMVIMVVLMKRG